MSIIFCLYCMFIKNPFTSVFLLVFITIGLLVLLSFLPKDFAIASIGIKPVDLFSDLRVEEPDSLLLSYKPQIEEIVDTQVPIDELLQKLTIPIEDFSENQSSNLSQFYNALTNIAENEEIRIAYYGDSIIEGDLFSQDLRNYLQKRFGGTGVGFVPITNNNSSARNTIIQNYSDSFLYYNLLHKKPNWFYYGINGCVYLTDTTNTIDSTNNIKNYWVEYFHPQNKNFSTVKVFYTSKSDSSYLSYSTGAEVQTLKLSNNGYISEVVLTNINSPKIRFSFSKHLILYGMSFESGKGVYVDNFSIRGHSGLLLTRIPQSVLQSFDRFLNYKLVILQFGANVLSEETKDYGWYQDGMIKVINHIKTAFPNAGILLISSSDRSMKDINGFRTIPSLNKLIDAQRNAARITKVCFWNIFKAMGGKNSMPLWVNENLASSDYTHFNHAGAKKLSYKLTKSLFQNM